ncbi:MAG: hypothetical protein V4654_05520 [Bdellovibrionota bacterium]
MKHLVIFSIVAMTAFSALAADNALTGSCKVWTTTSSETHSFSAAPNEKWRLGIAEETAAHGYKQFKVSIVNNIGNKESANNWGHRVLISIATLDHEFANPPVLCPRTPLADRQVCERDNELSGSYGTRFDRFGERYNDGFVDRDAAIYPLTSFKDGAILKTPVIKLSETTSVQCRAKFTK